MNRFQIFISYRTDDTRHFVSRLRATFAKELPGDLTFFDKDSLDVGVPFRDAITDAITGSAVVVVVIASEWFAEHNRRRLWAADDPVRMEVETALRSRKKVLPLLVDDARLPRAEELPPSMQGLFEHHSIRIRSETYDDDADRLVRVIDGLVAQASPDRQVDTGKIFPDSGESSSTYSNLVIAGIAIPTFVWIFFPVHGGVRDLLSVLFGVAVVAGYFYLRARSDRLAVDVAGVEVRKVGVTHRFSWSDIDRLDLHSTKKGVFLVARRADDRLKKEYRQAQKWPRWDDRLGCLVICDLKVEASRTSGGKDGGTIIFTADRYTGATDSSVLDAVKRYKPVGGFGGLPRTEDLSSRRGNNEWTGLAMAIVLAVLATVIALSIARSTDSPSTTKRPLHTLPAPVLTTQIW